MDGIFVTYHNTSRVFGFQYVTLEDMDECLYTNKEAGPYIFENCLKLMQIISDEITHHFPEQVCNPRTPSLLHSFSLYVYICYNLIGTIERSVPVEHYH